ncbi:MAG: 16S rRNA (adenine(1518)-N(6)/adenine(1519)-N(6))-dimethyltransferase RsmA [Acidobacteriota bacterium]|nr:16S rRNA (adenine(1518)-N(6)/adenine(1519)-N(6))-dimethyltransferase RsmA [Acidobacteriota bacterium]
MAKVTPHAGGNHKPKLGQNFLVDQDAMQRIVDALGDISATTVVEIGPGEAALTELLARRAGRLIAVELDRVLAASLRMKFAPLTNVEILEADILAVDLRTVLGQTPGPLRDLRPTGLFKAHVVGNLPYYITSDILLKLFTAAPRINLLVAMVQKEVADRVAAAPGSRDYGLLSATAQMYGRAEKLFELGPESFDPPPTVKSAVFRMSMAPRFDELQVDEAGFIAFLKIMFAQKRKTVSNNLKLAYPKNVVAAALQAAEIVPATRAEAIPLEEMARLYRALPRPEAAERKLP